MRLFGRKAEGAAHGRGRPALARRLDWPGAVRTGEPAWDYAMQVRDAFHRNPVAQRAVRLVAEGAATIPLYSADDSAEGALVVRLIAPGIVETVAAQLLLHGNAFVQIAEDTGGPARLFPLRPERVTIELDARGWPAVYVHRVGESVTRLAAVDGAGRPALVHLRALDPIDDHYGAGCLGAASAAVAAHNAAARWNRSLMDNAARPSGALIHDAGESGGRLSNDQFERLRGELDASFAGGGNAGRPMLLDGGLKWQAMSLTPADMDFADLKAGAARDIALAFGVPPMILGLPGDNTYSNYAEANRALWRLTIVPLAERIVRGLVEGLRAWWPGIALKLDLDMLPALASDRAAVWSQLKDADFLTTDEKRDALGFPSLGSVQRT